MKGYFMAKNSFVVELTFKDFEFVIFYLILVV